MFRPLAICVLLCPLPAAAELISASLIYVIDGDTIDAKAIGLGLSASTRQKPIGHNATTSWPLAAPRLRGCAIF